MPLLVSFARQTLTVLRAREVVDHGALVRDWGTVLTHESAGWSLDPGPGTEDLQHRDGVRIDITARGPFDADIDPSDRIVVDGETYQIIGPVQRWRSPTGRISHTVLSLQAWKEAP